VASFSGWVRRLLGLDAVGDTHALIPTKSGAQLALVVSESSASLAIMYQDVLRKAGIPVLAREWGGGSALVGGVPVGMSLYVPVDRAEEARHLLGVDGAENHEGVQNGEGGQTP
jgi:Putative prokaryotic signal transducing protein